MGGEIIRHAPGSTEALEGCPKACQIFKDAGWFESFQMLEGLEGSVSMEFAKNLERNQTEVRGLKLEVMEEVIARVIGLPAEGKRWFNGKVNDPSLKGDFLQEEESLVKKGRGIDRLSLP